MASGPYNFTKLLENEQSYYLLEEAGTEKDCNTVSVPLSKIGIHSCS